MALPSSCDGYLRRVILVCQVFGAFPYRLEGGILVRSGKYSVLTSIMAVLVASIALLIFISPKSLPVKNQQLLENSVALLLYRACVVSYPFMLAMNVILTSQGIPSLNLLLQLVNDFGVSAGSPATQEVLDWCFLVAWLSSMSIYFVSLFKGYSIPAEVFLVSYYHFLLLGIGTTVWLFSGFCHLLSGNFSALSYHLHQQSTNSYRIAALIRAHSRLGTACAFLNSVYTRQLFIILTLCFCQIVVSLFFLVSFLMHTTVGPVEQLHYIFKRLSWSSAHMILALKIVTPCDVIKQKEKEFDIILYRLMIVDKTGGTISDAMLTLHLSIKKEIVFTASAFFNLDFALIYAMISFGTTYLVVLVQFGQESSVEATSQAGHNVDGSVTSSYQFPTIPY